MFVIGIKVHKKGHNSLKKKTAKRLMYFSIIRAQTLKKARKSHYLGDKKREDKNRYSEKRDKIQSLKITAPAVIDLYRPSNHTELMEFIGKLRSVVASQQSVFICFRHTTTITAAGGLMLLAETDRLVKHFGAHKLKASYPKISTDKFGKKNQTAESILNKIGFYSLIGQPTRNVHQAQNVRCWEAVSDTRAEGAIAGKLLEKIDSSVDSQRKRKLYKGCIEALSNACEHAYLDIRKDGLHIEDKRWWMFIAVMQNKLAVLVCDLGVGIPNTIYKTQTPDFLDRIFKSLGIVQKSDCELIKTATLIKRSRTEKDYRGKGGADLRYLVESDIKASLSIFSNKGRFRLSPQGEQIYDNKLSIKGTIIEWSIEL